MREKRRPPDAATVPMMPWRVKTLGSTARRWWPVYLVGLVTLVTGLTDMLQGHFIRFASLPHLLGVDLPFGLHGAGRSLIVASGFGLVYLSLQLFQRRRTAWLIATGLSALAVLVHLLRGNAWYTAAAPAATFAALLVFRARFSVRSEITSVGQGLLLLALGLLVALAYGTLGFWLLDRRDFGVEFHLSDAFARTLREFSLIGNDDLVARSRHARWFLVSLRVLGVTVGIFGLYSLFRPVAYRLRTLPHERTVVREILAGYGRSPLDYFKLWSDKSYFFSQGRDAVIAYKASLSVAISLGDPVGPDARLEPLTRDFLAYCADNGWSAAFHQVLPNLVPMYRGLGLDVLKIGEEAIIDLERFSTTTVENKELRRVRHKFQRDGYTVVRTRPPHRPSLLEEVREVSDEWLLLPGRRERGFTLGRFDRNYVAETPLAMLQDASGRAIAFVNEIPAYAAGMATIDLMRHRRDIPNGAMDFLFLELMLALRQERYQRFSLGLAPFSGVGDRPGAGVQERAVHQMFEHLNRFFSYKGLRAYKAKFEPVWEDSFLVYQGGPLGLARTALALRRATEG